MEARLRRRHPRPAAAARAAAAAAADDRRPADPGARARPGRLRGLHRGARPEHPHRARGDFVYNGTHVWTADTDAHRRIDWAHNLARIADLGAERVVAATGRPAPTTTRCG
ncbi:hypothetical protein ACFQ1I_23550 [Kitasatospora arboriphila]